MSSHLDLSLNSPEICLTCQPIRNQVFLLRHEHDITMMRRHCPNPLSLSPSLSVSQVSLRAWWTSSSLKKEVISLWWSRQTSGSSFVWLRPIAAGPKSPSVSSSSAGSPTDVSLCRRMTSSWRRKPWTPVAAGGIPFRCRRRYRRCWRALRAQRWVSGCPARSALMPVQHSSWSPPALSHRSGPTSGNNPTGPSSWLWSGRRMAVTHGGAGSVGWSVTGRSASAANGSSMSTSKTSAGTTG